MTDLTIILLLKDRQEYNYRFLSHFLENNYNIVKYVFFSSVATYGKSQNGKNENGKRK